LRWSGREREERDRDRAEKKASLARFLSLNKKTGDEEKYENQPFLVETEGVFSI
jgi:hypothetical protein